MSVTKFSYIRSQTDDGIQFDRLYASFLALLPECASEQGYVVGLGALNVCTKNL